MVAELETKSKTFLTSLFNINDDVYVIVNDKQKNTWSIVNSFIIDSATDYYAIWSLPGWYHRDQMAFTKEIALDILSKMMQGDEND